MQIVVIIVIWVISLLVIYMLFLICLDPLLNKRIHKASANIGYHEHNNEEVNIPFSFSFFLKFIRRYKISNILKLNIIMLFSFNYKGRCISCTWNISSNGREGQCFESRWTSARQVETTSSGTKTKYL